MPSRVKSSTIFEIFRIAGVVLGFLLAESYGVSNEEKLRILTGFLSISLAGITGLESLILCSKTSTSIGYAPSPQYQRQSGLNNIATAVGGCVVVSLSWGAKAYTAILIVLLGFFFLSGINHAYSAICEGNRSIKNAFRLILSIAVILATYPYVKNCF